MARILVVDDDESLTTVLTHYLRMARHVPLVAPTGHAALLAARTHPDVILLDLGLPDISGDEVLRRLKRDPYTALIPVVVVSGEPDAAYRVPRGGITGAVAILQKPMLGSELCAVVDLVLEGPTPDTDAMISRRDCQQKEIVYRLISTGSDPLVRQVFRRLVADRACHPDGAAAQAPSWRDVARVGRQEGLLNDGEGALLAARPALATASW